MKAVVAAFNQEKALVGAFSEIVQPVVEPMDRLTALGYSGATPATISQFVAAVSWSCSVARPAPAQLRILRINIANLEQVCRFQFQQMWVAAS